MMVSSPIQEIKEKLDIVEFIRSYITLTPAGKNFKALCPFHKEKTASFMVSPERQTWHCFGACNEGGDIFKFLMKYENLEFYEALKVLAEKAGIELRRISPQEHKQFGILYDINNLAKDFFKKELNEAPGILKYLKERGLKDETITEFELGFAPDSFDKLTLHLINVGFSMADVERAGLAYKTERGRYMDRFRGRIMFPIHNSFGKVVGFSGRLAPEYEKREEAGLGKYVNSPETPIFNKSRILYGFHKAKNYIKEANAVVLVEGQMDFLALYQDGVKNAVATSGTALTPDHLRTLRRLTDQLILCFDNDEAGFKAAERSIDLANANDFSVKLLILKDYKDPAEAIQKKPGIITELFKDVILAMDFYFERYLGKVTKGVKGEAGELKKKLRLVLAKIKNLASPVERAHWIKELSGRAGIDERALMEEMEQMKKSNEYGVMRNEATILNTQYSKLTTSSRRELIAERILSLIIAREQLKEQIKEYLEYLPEDYLMLMRHLSEEEQVVEERLLNLLSLISLRSSFEIEVLGEEKLEQEFKELLKQIRLEYLREKRQGLVELIKEYEKNGDEEKMQPILREFDEVSKMMQN